jgi:predicted metal-dependent enzyme (double-stranded beta helix superfamily)
MGNGIRETRYRRVDDRDQEGVALLEQDRSTLVKPGEISLLVPDTDEIHAMANDTDRSTVEIHVYGKDLVNLTRYRYDVAAKRVIAFASPKFDNC